MPELRLADPIQLDFSEEMKNSYRDYAVSVIVDRALPDVRDGLKPVQRRILYAMTQLGLEPKKPHRKSARIVGDTMGKYHPHGDSSIYEALVHMSENYSLSIPLVDGHGNFGSIDGDPAAAMRYTEARLSEGAMTMLENLEHNLVDFNPNFDNSEKEPKVLPALLPNLLINGTTGIAVGMATNIPPHNPGEVIDGCIAYMENPEITTDELMQYIPGPDFPTGGIIVNSDEIKGIYETGDGKLRVRGKTVIEPGDNGKTNIIITEIPYTSTGNKQRLVEGLVDLMKNKTFEEIADVRDESSKDVRVVIEVKKDRDAENLLNGLYKKSDLEATYSVNLLAVKDQQPIVFTLKSLIKEFIDFQEELYTKEFKNRLEKAQDRLEVVGGLLRATDIIDLIIEILRGSQSVKQAKECLTKGIVAEIKFKSEESKKQAAKLDFTERQADAILSMQLSRLIGLEILKLTDEENSLKKNIAEYEKVLGSVKELHKVIKKQLLEFRSKFATPRKTVITTLEQTNYVIEEKIEDIYVLIDRFGYTKSVDANAYYKASSEAIKEYVYAIKMLSNDKLCLFTAQGSMFTVKAAAIPRTKLREKGTLIHNLAKIGKEEVIMYTSFEELFECSFLFTTRSGFVKIVSGIEFDTVRGQIAATKLDDGDSLVSVVKLTATDVLSDNRKVYMLTHKGLSLAFSLSEVAEYKKTSRGVKGIELDDGDYVVFTGVAAPGDEKFVYKEKEMSIKKIKEKKRGNKGSKTTL